MSEHQPVSDPGHAAQRALERLMNSETGIDPAWPAGQETEVNATLPSVSEELMNLLWLCIDDLLTAEDEQRLDDLLLAEPAGLLHLRRLVRVTAALDEDDSEDERVPETRTPTKRALATQTHGLTVFRSTRGLRAIRRTGAAARSDLAQARSENEHCTLVEDELKLANCVIRLHISERGSEQCDLRITMTNLAPDLRTGTAEASLFRAGADVENTSPLISASFQGNIVQFNRLRTGQFIIVLSVNGQSFDSLLLTITPDTDSGGPS